MSEPALDPSTPPARADGLDPPAARRGFLTQAAALVVGALAALGPLSAGLFVFFDPLRRNSQRREPILVTTLDTLPDDGRPRQFAVVADRMDAWNRFENEPIGGVYLMRTETGEVKAFNTLCPHAGCFVDFKSDRGQYECPCHHSEFQLGGERVDPKNCPAPRGLDELAVEIRNGNQVWVTYETFRAGIAERIPDA